MLGSTVRTVEVASLGYRTDLALLKLGGSVIEDRGDHLVVRSPHNPTHWWGNFLLLNRAPPRDDAGIWLNRFADAFPAATHVALGFDGTNGTVDQLAVFGELGLRPEAQAVMTATAVHEPARRHPTAVLRALRSDRDWAQSAELRIRCDAGEYHPDDHPAFVHAKVATNRRLVRAGHGDWFGAFIDDVLVAQLGLFTASPGLARFQMVETHPDFRRHGLAGSLVHHASRFGFDILRAKTLVMVADPDYFAIDLYRSVGFQETQSQLQVERPPAEPGPTDPPPA